MKSNSIYYTLFIFFFLQGVSTAQQPCGTEPDPNPTSYSSHQLETQFEKMNSGTRTARIFMIAIHIVRTDNGKLGISEQSLFSALEATNNFYANADIRFELCTAINYIDDSDYSSCSKKEAKVLASQMNISNVINLYFFNRITHKSRSICGSSTFPSAPPSERYIFMKNSCTKNGSTLTHEFGHYFGLRHTHETANGREKVERTNCSYAGDGFCDTPADPRLSSSTVSNCQYTSQIKDINGDIYSPMVENYMSYAPSSCRIAMTNQQLAHMNLVSKNENAYHYKECSTFDLSLVSTYGKTINFSSKKATSLKIEIHAISITEDIYPSFEVVFKTKDGEIILSKGTLHFSEENNYITKEITIPFDQNLFNANEIIMYIDRENSIFELNEYNNRLKFDIDLNLDTEKSFLYPSPSHDVINIISNNSLLGDTQLTLYNSSGEFISKIKLNRGNRNGYSQFDIRSLPNGVYFLNINFKDLETETLKFVKVK